MSKSIKKVKEWTEARHRAFITGVLRSGMRRWPPKYETLKEAFTDTKINKVSNRKARHYLCAQCNEDFASTGVQVDHIEPAVDPNEGFVSWDRFIERLYVPKEKLQVLCKGCHKIKTASERVKRSENK